MDKSKTFVHFLAAIAFVVFAIILFNIAGGSISMERVQKEDGAFTFGGLMPMLIAFDICIILLAGLITVLQDGEFSAWLSSCGVIIGISLVGILFDFSSLAGVIVAGLYMIWWFVASVRTLRAAWGEYGILANALMALCRFVLTAALFTFVQTWVTVPVSIGEVPNMEVISISCRVSGVASILAAVALVVEASLWIKYSYY